MYLCSDSLEMTIVLVHLSDKVYLPFRVSREFCVSTTRGNSPRGQAAWDTLFDGMIQIEDNLRAQGLLV